MTQAYASSLSLVCIEVVWYKAVRAPEKVLHDVVPYVVEAPTVFNDEVNVFVPAVLSTCGVVVAVVSLLALLLLSTALISLARPIRLEILPQGSVHTWPANISISAYTIYMCYY